ncbi:hypothetical protein BH11PLA2_BH11PLA2_28940 [soil metagenome]
MAAGAQGIRAGAAYVELFVKDNRLVRGLASASAKLKAFGAGLTGIGSQLLGVGTALATPFALAAKLFADMGSDLVDMSQRTGVSVEALSELGFAAEQSGADMETLEAGLRKMQKFVVEAAGGSKEARDALGKLGLAVADLKALAPDDQFKLIAEKLSKIENPALRAALAMDIFGKSGTKLLPLMIDGAEGIEKLQEKARKLGLTISTEDAAAAEEFGDTLDVVWKVLKRGVFTIGAALVPSLMDLANWIITTTKDVSAWIDRNRGLVVSVAQITAVVVGIGAALVALGVAVSIAGFAISGLVSLFSVLSTVVGVIGSVLGALLSPIGLVAAALVGLGYLFATETDTGMAMVNELKAGFMSFADTAKTAWGGIVDAIQAGDIGLAARIGLAGVSLEWAKAVLWWTEKWNAFKGIFVDGWRDAVAGLKLMFWDFTAWIARTFSAAIEKIVQATAWVADKVGLDDLAKNLRENFDFSDANINRNRDRIKGEILDERLAKQKEADAARKADAAGAMDDVKKAADELRDAVDEAARKRAAVGQRVPEKAKSGSMSELDEVVDLAKKVDIQGTFNASAIRGLGAESLNERTAKAVDQINDNVKKLVAEAQHGGLVFA